MRFGFQAREAAPLGSAVPRQRQHQHDKEPKFTTIALDGDAIRLDSYQSSSQPSKQPLLSQQNVEYRGNNGSEHSLSSKPWRPLMLRRWVLVTFAVVFILLIMSLEVILKVSIEHNGFDSAQSNLYYVWTYGPTAVFTIIAAFWTQVEYRSRQMQPWEEMAKKPQPVANSLLLDYISPNPIIAFFRSIKNRHLPVATALFGSLLIKILIVISTGIFTLQPMVVPQSLSMEMQQSFQFSGFNASKVDDVAGLAYAGASFNEIDYLPGTNAEYAVELFNASSAVQADTYNLTTIGKTFTADLECEPATIDPNVTVYCPSWSGCTNVYDIMIAHNENCHMSAFPKDNTSFIVDNRNPWGSWYGGVLPGTCDGKAGDADLDRIVVFVLYKDKGPLITNSTALFCKPSFRLQQSTVTIDQNGTLISVDDSTLLPAPSGLTTVTLSDAIRNTVSQLDSELNAELARKYRIRPQQLFVSSVFAGLILRSMDSNELKNFWDSEKITLGVQKIYKSVAAQIAKRYFLTPNSTTSATKLEGTATYDHQRLFVRHSTMRAIEALLSVLVLLSLYLGFRRVPVTTPQDPASIARLASMISQSQNLDLLMSTAGSVSLKSVESLLSGKYGLTYVRPIDGDESRQPHFVIESYDTDMSKPMHVASTYWRPISARWYSRIALVLVPLAIIVALEIIFRQSHSNHGLLDVESSRWTQYGSSFVPALIMVLTKLLFSGSNFDLRIVDPYVQLKEGFAKAKTSVVNKTVYTWKADAAWIAFLNGRVAVGASTLGVIVASFLTVAASGLYSTAPVAHQEFANLTRLDNFYDPTTMLSNLNETLNYTTAMSARLVVYDQMTNPQWTSGPFVLPNLTSSTNKTESISNVSSINVKLPARRGALTCQNLPRDQVTLSYSWFDRNNKSGVAVRWPMLEQYNCTFLTIDKQPSVQVIGPSDGPFGTWTNFAFETSKRAPPFNDRPCPTSYGLYGQWQGNRATELNVVLCWSSVQELQASAQFSMPGWKLRSLQADERTMRNVSSTPDTQVNLAANVFGGSKGNISTSLDNVFTAFLRNSTTNTIDASLLQHENWEKLYARINGVYGRATAQIISREGRYTNLTSPSPVAATQTSYSTYRLRQNLISTRILQSLLIAMILCSVVSLLTIDLRDVLPKNPCSIAAQASLVAGSQMMAEMPREAQWMDDKKFYAMFEGGRFRMGWSEGVEGEGTFGVDVDRTVMERHGGWWTKMWAWKALVKR